MKKLVLLAAIMAALVTVLAVASIADDGNVGGVIQDSSNGIPGGMPPPPGFETPNTPASQAVRNDTEISNMTSSLAPVEQQLAAAESSGDTDTVNSLQPQVAEQVENIVYRINQVTRKSLTRADGIVVLTKLGIWGPTSNWAKSEVEEAYATGRMVGDHDGATADDEQGGRPATRQELATVGNRIADKAASDLNSHSRWDIREHQALWAAITNNRMWRWIVPLCLLAALVLIALYLLSRRRRRRRNDDDDESRDEVPWARRTYGRSYGTGTAWPQGGRTTN